MSKNMRRKIDMIKEELIRRGHDIEEKEIVKNGIRRYVLQVNTDNNVRPLIYVDKIIIYGEEKNMIFSEIIEFIEEQISRQVVKTDLNIMEFVSKDYAMKNAYIALQKISGKNEIKRPGAFDGTEEVINIRIPFQGRLATMSVSEELLGIIKVSEEELWQQALKNTSEETLITELGGESFKDMIIKDMGEDVPAEILEDLEIMTRHIDSMDPNRRLYLLTNADHYKGASAILNKGMIRDLAKRINAKCFAVIPASIHECILAPDIIECEDLEKIIHEVNVEQVDEEEQLSDKPIFINFMEV